jgi:hypothetical protein
MMIIYLFVVIWAAGRIEGNGEARRTPKPISTLVHSDDGIETLRWRLADSQFGAY